MPARKNPVPTVKLTTTLPADVHDKLSLYLYSESECRIPKGAYQDFISARVREFFSHRRIDLAPFLGTDPGVCIISGAVDTIQLLEERLSR